MTAGQEQLQSSQPEAYKLRGNRVPSMHSEQIRLYAEFCRNLIGLKKRNKRFDLAIENRLEQLFNIQLDLVEDEDWWNVCLGYYNPSTRMISVPMSTYIKACNGDTHSLFVMFHEIGHAILGHQAVLHLTNTPPTREEDAEWQADYFADALLESLGMSRFVQLELFTQ